MAETEKKRTLRVPHVYTIILVLMAVFAVLTWVVPSGSFERQEVNGREVTVSGTYEPVDKVYTDEDGNEVDLRQGIFEVLEAPAIGIQQAVEVVAFIMIVGGSFQVITATGAITSGVARVVKKFKSKDVLIIPILMVRFALGGSTFGMAEETLPFFAILVLSGLQFISGDDGHGLRLNYSVHDGVCGCPYRIHRIYRKPVQRPDFPGHPRYPGQPPALVAYYRPCRAHCSCHRMGCDVCPQG